MWTCAGNPCRMCARGPTSQAPSTRRKTASVPLVNYAPLESIRMVPKVPVNPMGLCLLSTDLEKVIEREGGGEGEKGQRQAWGRSMAVPVGFHAPLLTSRMARESCLSLVPEKGPDTSILGPNEAEEIPCLDE